MNKKPQTQECKWCGDKNLGFPQFLDEDGTLCSISGEAGILSHAYDDAWWSCLKFGVEWHLPAVASSTNGGKRGKGKQSNGKGNS